MAKEKPLIIGMIMGKWVGGGVEAVIMNYYRHINRNKIQFDFICDEDSTDIPYDEIKKLGGRVILVPPYQHLFKYNKALKELFRKNKYKIVHSNINTLSVFPLRIAKREGIPVRIAHSHSTTNKKEWKKNILKQILRPFSRKYATDYFACTEHAGRWLFGNKVYNQGRVKIINNGIEIDKFLFDCKVREKIRKELNFKDTDIVIGHIGRFMKQKNHSFIIDVFNKLHKDNNNYKLMLVGQGPLMVEIKEKVKSLGIEDSVKFLGQRTDVNDMYQAMDLFLFPSLYEGLGIVMIEAQCSGLPCVASTEVPDITNISDSVKYIDLKKDSDYWASIIIPFLNTNNRINNVNFSKFNILQEVKVLENYYISKVLKIKVLQCGMTSNLGGIESFIINYVNNMKRDMFQFDFINIYTDKLFFESKLVKLDCNIYRVPNYYKHPIKYIKTVKSIIRNNNYDIIHCNMNSAVMIFPLIAAKMARSKIIISHAHNSSSDKGIIKELMHCVNRNIIPFLANYYFSCSEKAGKWFFSKKIINSKQYSIVYNSIDVERFRFNIKKRDIKRKELNIGLDEVVIGHIGRFNKQKNHLFLIDIFYNIIQKNHNVKLLLIGQGPLEDEVKRKVENLGITDNVLFLGQRNDVPEIMFAMDILIFPSLYEGLPLVGVEAQCAGLSLYLSDQITREVEIVDDLTFIPLSIGSEEWAKRINIILNNNNKNRLSKYNQVYNSYYNIKLSSKMLEEKYQEIMKREL